MVEEWLIGMTYFRLVHAKILFELVTFKLRTKR